LALQGTVIVKCLMGSHKGLVIGRKERKMKGKDHTKVEQAKAASGKYLFNRS
jgi:hypothetical protein